MAQATYFTRITFGIPRAKRWTANFREAQQILQRHPELGAMRYSTPKYPDLRYLVIDGGYLLLYNVNAATNQIEVIRVLHGSRDVDFALGQEHEQG